MGAIHIFEDTDHPHEGPEVSGGQAGHHDDEPLLIEAVEPTEATVPAPPGDCDERLVGLSDPASIMAEEYRAIRTGMLARWQHGRHLIHTITSATPQEGKTITTLNLGLSFSELDNRRTLVVEADLRLPQFDKLMPLASGPGPGLVGLLRGEASLSEAVRPVAGHGLHVLPAGQRAGNEAAQLLSSPAMASLLQVLRQQYDHVLIDTPPVVELADAGILGAMSDEVLLVARMDRTPRPLMEQAIRILSSYRAPLAGLIATDQRRPRGTYGYRYGYRYGERYAARAA